MLRRTYIQQHNLSCPFKQEEKRFNYFATALLSNSKWRACLECKFEAKLLISIGLMFLLIK